ncbi:MAG: pesticin C-terminus-like muramidase [Acidithiobacillus sp.]
MRRRRSAAASPLNVLTLAVGAMLAGAGDADAMDCSRASTSAEWTICGDKNLLLLDRDLTIVYHKFIKVFSDTRHCTHLVAETRTGQKEWLRKRNACGTDAACIKAAYEKRLALLQSHVCYPRDDSPIYQKPAPVPKPVPQSAPQPKQSQGTASDCTSAYKVDWSFLSVSEGGVWVEGYVPGYHREDSNNAGHIDKTRHYNSPDANSGVTIGKGVDLARQTPKKFRQDFQIYIKANGNSGNIDYEEIIRSLSPYMNKKLTGWAAVEKVKRDSPSLSKEEADFLTQAVEFRFVRQVEGQFNRKNEIGTTFQQLPAEAQTVLLDFSYNYGSSDAMAKKEKKTKQDSTRNITWSSYYSGEWQTLATKLQNFDIPDHRAMYKERRTREGKLLQRAVDEKRLPDKGNPCPSNDPKRTALFERRYLFFRYPERSMWS